MRPLGGTPIEEAPVWVLGLLTFFIWLVVFPALVGLLNGFGMVAGGLRTLAAVAGVISLLLVFGLARQKRWRRPTPREPWVEVPLFVRFSTWFFASLMVPNVLYGVLVVSRRGEGLDYASAWLIGLLVSAIHGGFALTHRLRRTRTS